MRASLFLIINGLIIFYIVSRIIFGGRRDRPTSLRFDESDAKPPQRPQNRGGGNQERVLDCRFVHAGKSYDSFEILGLPAGSDRETCFRAYLDQKSHSSRDQTILAAAWQALERRFSGF